VSKANESKETNIQVRLPKTGYAKTMYFNRFRVENEDGFFMLHFGLVGKSAVILDSYACVIPQKAIEHQRDNLLGYLNRMGLPKVSATHKWQPPLSVGQTAQLADIISMAYSNDIAETTFSTFSMCTAVQMRRENDDSLEAQPLALLRSTAELQRQLISALYAA
jgi:hypothetical protein